MNSECIKALTPLRGASTWTEQDQADRMRVDVVWLSVALLSFPLFTQCLTPLNIMVAPNLLRVGTKEKIFVEIQDHTGGGNINVNIRVMNYPRKTSELTSTQVTLTADKKYQALTEIMIDEADKHFTDSAVEKQYVYLQAQFPTGLLEKVVMVSFQSGFIFVQTDKSIYTPGTAVQYRLFSMSPDLQPVDQSAVVLEVINPQKISVIAETYNTKQGIITGRYLLPDISSPGMWNVAVYYKETPQKNFTAEFEVKEYVLPSFEVTLKPSKAFFYVDDQEFTVDISAKYLFGKKVYGNAFVSFGVVKDDIKTELPAALSRVSIVDGEGQVTLTREMIKASFNDVNQLNGGSLYIAARVLTSTASEIVEAHRRNIPIVQSPYTIHFKKTSQYFKPGMSFDVTVLVTNPDETPAENTDVIVTTGSGDPVRGKTKSNGMAKVIVNTQAGISNLEVTVKTADPRVAAGRQAESKMIAKAYETKGTSNYLHISIDAAELEIGDQMQVNLHFGKSQIQNQDFTYMLLSKGQIVQAKRFEGKGQSLVTFSLPVTKELVPSFRVVAYYHVGVTEVVSDSIWVDVKDTCMGSLKLSVKDNPKAFEPGDPFKLIITGDPSAKVGLVAVDKGVFVLNKNRLTQTKVWDIVEKHDTGCTAGGGKDSMGVFHDAGLIFESDKAGGSSPRTDRECPTPPKRKRRAQSLLQITQSLTGKYEGELKKCCTDGLKKNNMGYTCERRSTHITDGEECRKAFLHCCSEILKHKQEDRQTLELSRTVEDDDDFIGQDEIVTRSQFPESWLWLDVDLPACGGNKPCETTSLQMKENYLQDSITTWQVLAISLSKTHGICVADPFEMIVVKDFFVDLKLPYSVVRNEQVEIRAVIHNYSKKTQKVRVDFLETDKICSGASKKKKYRTVTNVDSQSTKAIPFVIIPMETGDYPLEVQVSTSTYSDAVKKTLKVVSEGVLTEKWELNAALNPSEKPGGVQVLRVRSEVPDGQVPGTAASTYITVTGEDISLTIEQVINGDFMGRLIVQPHGCGEQTMIFMTLPLITTHYLDSTNQWDAVGIHRRNEAVQHIKTGYERELTFRKADGSYGAWIHHPSSTWLTAYVTKVFAMASDIIVIREETLCSSVKWLVLNAQNPDGTFTDPAPVIHGEMVGDVRGKDADASLTAFVLIAMQEANDLCKGSVSSLPNSMKKAVDYLERRLVSLTNPYAVAMTSYALANAGKGNKEILLKCSSDDGTYWKVPGHHHFSLEATAYALLALVKMKEINIAGKSVNWLNRQSSQYGAHGTTQATIMVFQAVAEYYKQGRRDENRELDVELAVSGRTRPVKWNFKKSNFPVTRSDKVKLMQNFNVTAMGSGAGAIKVVTLYYAKPSENAGECKTFSLSVDMQREVSDNDDEVYMLTIEYLYKNPDRDATMSILDISMLTGFKVDDADLKELSTGKERYFEKFEQNKVLTERGSLIIYLDKVRRNLPEKLAFRIHKITPSALLQPASVSIYEYYSPKERCVKYYHPVKKDGALNRLCSNEDGLCECAEENCSVQKKQNIKENERDTKACEPGMDYVYKVKVLSMDFKGYSDFYTMKVEEVLKEGSDLGVQGQERIFMGHSNCRDYFAFEEGKTYLIMGQSVDLPRPQGRKQYILGEQTWIEYWPTQEEGQTPEYRDKYIGIRALEQSLADFGCSV